MDMVETAGLVQKGVGMETVVSPTFLAAVEVMDIREGVQLLLRAMEELGW